MKNYLAQGIPIAPPGGFKGLGTGLFATPGNGIDVFTKVISTIIGVMTIVAFIWFVFNIFIGAIGIISSGGDKQALETARKKITTSLIGIVVVVAAIFIIQFVGLILGIDVLNLPVLYQQLIT